MKVCRYDQGNTPLFTCPYHNWSFATDGKLVGVPMHKELYPDLDRSEWSLIEVPRMVNYKGAIFASWDPRAPEFVDYLGDAKDHLDQVLDCRDGREGGSEVFGGVHKWIIPANWKFAAENFCGDTYHNPSHRSVDLIGIGPSRRKGGTAGGATTNIRAGGTSGSASRRARRPQRVDAAEPALCRNLPGQQDRRRLFPPLLSRANAPARRQGAAAAVHRHDLSEHVVSRPPAARLVRLAPGQRDADRGVALLPGRSRRARRGQGAAAALLHALCRSRPG